MTARGATTRLRIVFDAGMPTARWGPLFHVFRLEHPDLRLEWQPAGFPIRGRSLLEGSDAGLFVEPPPEEGRSALTLDVSPMAVIVAAGDRLAHNAELRVTDILDRPVPGGPDLNPEWTSFWTLDEQRGGAATRTADDVKSAKDGVEGTRGFINFLKEKFPNNKSEIKRIFADGDYVIVHVHAVREPGPRGNAIMDIFRMDENGKVTSAGGRVLAVVALGEDLVEARERAYDGIGTIGLEGSQFRSDIALLRLRAEPSHRD